MPKLVSRDENKLSRPTPYDGAYFLGGMYVSEMGKKLRGGQKHGKRIGDGSGDSLGSKMECEQRGMQSFFSGLKHFMESCMKNYSKRRTEITHPSIFY